MRKVTEHQINVAGHQRAQQVHVTCETVELGEDHSGADGLGVREGLSELGAVTALAALSLHVFGRERPPTAV